MSNYKELVAQFHKTMFIKTGDYKTDTNQTYTYKCPTARLRATLIEEEAKELCDELRNGGSIENIRKELCDLLYVVFGTVVVFNLPVEQDFEQVHENNMLKFNTGSLRDDGKWVKSPNHPKVNLETSPYMPNVPEGAIA